MSPTPPRLRALDGVRVIAEFLVVRFHVLDHQNDGDWYQGVDLMSLFFVLGGFSSMYAYEREDFASLTRVAVFWRRKLLPIYALHLFHWLCWLPYVVMTRHSRAGCQVEMLCPWLQLAWLDQWAGCGLRGISNFPAWYLSCQVWMWVAFPVIKDTLVERLANRPNTWAKLGAIHAISTCTFLAAWQTPMMTLIGFPPARFAEFVIGGGAALALHKPSPSVLRDGRHWYLLGALVLAFTLCASNHTVTGVCLHETSDANCTFWERARPKPGPVTAPCNTWMDKIQSRNALLWAVFLHCVARTELDGTGGWPVRLLSSSPFRVLSGMSLSLYLGHENMYMLVVWLGERLFGVERRVWHSDALLFCVYLACYMLHCLILEAAQRWEGKTSPDAGASHETELLVLPPADEGLETPVTHQDAVSKDEKI